MSGQLQHARFAVAQDSEQSDLRDSEIVARGGRGEDRLHLERQLDQAVHQPQPCCLR